MIVCDNDADEIPTKYDEGADNGSVDVSCVTEFKSTNDSLEEISDVVCIGDKDNALLDAVDIDDEEDIDCVVESMTALTLEAVGKELVGDGEIFIIRGKLELSINSCELDGDVKIDDENAFVPVNLESVIMGLLLFVNADAFPDNCPSVVALCSVKLKRLSGFSEEVRN